MGFVFILGAIILLSVAGVFTGSVTQSVSPTIIILITYSAATLFFLLPKLCKSNMLFHRLKLQWKDVFWANIFTAGCWFGWFYSLKIFEPAVGTMVANAIAPIVILLLSNRFRPGGRIYGLEVLASLGISISLMVMLFLSFMGKSGIGVIENSDFKVGIFMVLLLGVSQPLYGLYSKRLSDSGFSSGDLMSVRFFLTITISIALCRPEDFAAISEVSKIIPIVVVSLVGTVLPIYLIQQGIKYSEPIVVTFALTFEPLIIFVFQFFDARIVVSYTSLWGILAAAIFSMVGIFGRWKQVDQLNPFNVSLKSIKVSSRRR